MTDASLDWPRIAADLNAQGWAMTGPLLTPATCEALQTLYDQPERFRSRIVMQRHGFGQGEYQYFADPLPDPLPRLRAGLLLDQNELAAFEFGRIAQQDGRL